MGTVIGCSVTHEPSIPDPRSFAQNGEARCRTPSRHPRLGLVLSFTHSPCRRARPPFLFCWSLASTAPGGVAARALVNPRPLLPRPVARGARGPLPSCPCRAAAVGCAHACFPGPLGPRRVRRACVVPSPAARRRPVRPGARRGAPCGGPRSAGRTPLLYGAVTGAGPRGRCSPIARPVLPEGTSVVSSAITQFHHALYAWLGSSRLGAGSAPRVSWFPAGRWVATARRCPPSALGPARLRTRVQSQHPPDAPPPCPRRQPKFLHAACPAIFRASVRPRC